MFTRAERGETAGMITARLSSRSARVPVSLDARDMREGAIVTIRRSGQLGHEIVAHEIVA